MPQINGILPYTVVHFTYQLSSANWYLCDGSNGTPNLLGALIKGVSPDSLSLGQRSGNSSADILPEHLPPHSHDIAAYEYVADTLQVNSPTGALRKIGNVTQWSTANAGVPVAIPTMPPSVKLYPYIYIP